VLLLVRRGPRAFWREATRGPFNHRPISGFPVSPSVSPRHPEPSVISPSGARDFLHEVFPASPLDPYLSANVALEEEYGPRSAEGFEYDAFRHDIWGDLAGVLFHVSGTGHLSFRSRSICPSTRPRAPALGGASLFDVVDVLLPFDVATAAIASGVYDRLLAAQDRSHRRYRGDL
jgi:hypothetical protein